MNNKELAAHNGCHSAYPQTAFDDQGQITTFDQEYTGLSKREYIATHLLSNMMHSLISDEGLIHATDRAVLVADLLLEKLQQ